MGRIPMTGEPMLSGDLTDENGMPWTAVVGPAPDGEPRLLITFAPVFDADPLNPSGDLPVSFDFGSFLTALAPPGMGDALRMVVMAPLPAAPPPGDDEHGRRGD